MERKRNKEQLIEENQRLKALVSYSYNYIEGLKSQLSELLLKFDYIEKTLRQEQDEYNKLILEMSKNEY